MPELPEVETVRLGLAPVLAGARLVRVEARRPDLRFPLPEGFVQRLTGARVEALDRRGKYLLARLDRGVRLLMHLGMTGRFEIEGGPSRRPGAFTQALAADPKHAHVVIETDRGARVTFFDPRRFGFMDLIEPEAFADHPRLAGLGPEPLSHAFDLAYLTAAFAGRRQSAKALLLDQTVVAGLGNIYVCETLHRAGISPLSPAGTIGRAKRRALLRAIREVLIEAIAKGGSTLRDFASAEGSLGYFQHAFEAYGQADRPCRTLRCQGVIRRIVQNGRSTFYCPACQR
jgi:formamidopyrimidine-DNA glycosylase